MLRGGAGPLPDRVRRRHDPRGARAMASMKVGDVAAGTTELAEAVAWFARSQLHYTRSLFTLWLSEGHLALGERSEARAALDTVLATTRENGYRHLEGMAERLLGEALGPEDPTATRASGSRRAASSRRLAPATRLPRSSSPRAGCHRQRATLPRRVQLSNRRWRSSPRSGRSTAHGSLASLLQSLPNGVDTERAQPAS